MWLQHTPRASWKQQPRPSHRALTGPLTALTLTAGWPRTLWPPSLSLFPFVKGALPGRALMSPEGSTVVGSSAPGWWEAGWRACLGLLFIPMFSAFTQGKAGSETLCACPGHTAGERQSQAAQVTVLREWLMPGGSTDSGTWRACCSPTGKPEQATWLLQASVFPSWSGGSGPSRCQVAVMTGLLPHDSTWP